MRHNNQLPNAHFRKDWQRRVKTWFDQPGKKETRRRLRAAKAARIAPRPVDGPLRPAVRCQTFKYNTKMRVGRGFTLAELKEAGIGRKEARTIGIAVDHRRKSRSEEGLRVNVERLQAYRKRLVLFPKRAGKPKKGDATAEQLASVTQLTGPLMPVQRAPVQEVEARPIDAAEKEAKVYAQLRKAWLDAKLVGVRAKKAKEEAEAEDAKKN